MQAHMRLIVLNVSNKRIRVDFKLATVSVVATRLLDAVTLMHAATSHTVVSVWSFHWPLREQVEIILPMGAWCVLSDPNTPFD